MPHGLLEGVKVADFCWALAGPRSTKVLSDHGATVVKIEGKNKRIDNQRVAPAFKDNIVGLNRGGRFNPYNTGKLSLALNLAHPKGVEVAKRLVAWADVVTENFAGGSMRRMGLGYEELKKVNPGIIMVSGSMLGQTGPYSTLAGFGTHLVAMAGLRNIAGWPDREPADLEVYTDFILSHFAVSSIISALLYRRRTGKGQYIDISQYESSVHFMSPLILDNAINHRVAHRIGNEYPYAVPYGAYRCRGEDRWCAIAVTTETEWENFCAVIGNPEWTKDTRFQTLAVRKENEHELDSLVNSWTIKHKAEDVMILLQNAGVPAGVVQTAEDIVEYDPQLKHRRFYWELDHPEVGKYRSPAPSFILSKTPCELRRAPLLGEHNEHVLRDLLGMSDDEIAELIIEQVVE